MTGLFRIEFLRFAWVATVLMLSGLVGGGFSYGQESPNPTGDQAEDSAHVLSQEPPDDPAPDTDTAEAESKDADTTDEDLLRVNPDFISAIKSLDASLKYEPEEEPVRIRNRIVMAGLFGGVVLGILGVLFGYLKLNHLTRGFYSGRLQTLSIACVVLILALCYFLWTQVLFK